MKNHALIALIACLSLYGNVSADDSPGNAVQLEERKVFTTRNIYGKCANALITVTGLDDESPFYDDSPWLDGQDALIEKGNGYISTEVKVLVLGPEREQERTVVPLSEQSLVHCVSTSSGKKVLIGTVCTGNHWSCAEPNYYLIDAENISEPDIEDGCDAKCINEKLGMNYISDGK